MKGRAWRSLRRKFATERKDAPLPDLAAVGGWKDFNTILKCYQRPDEDSMQRVLLERETPPAGLWSGLNRGGNRGSVRNAPPR